MIDRGDFDRSGYEADSSSEPTRYAENTQPEATQPPAANGNENAQLQNLAPAPPTGGANGNGNNGQGPLDSPGNGKASTLAVEKVDSYDASRITLEIQAEKGKTIILPAGTEVVAILV